MISRIKNKHLRRLALIAATPVVMILAPFSAIATEVPTIMSDWYSAFRQLWN
jgi:hypothetical protein